MQTDLLHEKPRQFFPAVFCPRAIGGINDPDQRIGFFEVVSPVRPESLLSADIPLK